MEKDKADECVTGMAGEQVLEWTDLDTEIKTAGLKDVGILLQS